MRPPKPTTGCIGAKPDELSHGGCGLMPIVLERECGMRLPASRPADVETNMKPHRDSGLGVLTLGGRYPSFVVMNK